ncbi:hypothetical protein MesoLjLa_49020 [Mesorhizobium sp. L-2-11]|nr:hypothetical protein MesoLjLa_49020 [Mesorhizobium sp. L-2-11]
MSCLLCHLCSRQVGLCARGQAELLIQVHKSQLAPDRTCRSPTANQVRLVRRLKWVDVALRSGRADELGELEEPFPIGAQ